MKEINEVIPHGQVEYAEHSKFARSKKVIYGPLHVVKADGPLRTKAPIHSALSGAVSLDLELNKAYRVISNTGFHYCLSRDSMTATTSDIYVPANTAVILATNGDYLKLNVIPNTGSGFIQAAEVL